MEVASRDGDWVELTDPVNRIFIFAFCDRSTLILRGKPEDIRQAKMVIRSFDVRPPGAGHPLDLGDE